MNTTDGAEQAAGEARDTVVAGLDALAERMLEYAEHHVGTRLDRAAAAVEEMFEEHSQQVQEMLGAVDSGAKDIAKEIVEDIEEQVTDRVSALVEHAAGTYLALEQAHDQAAESSGNEREETGERAGELFGCIAPMEQMVDQVRKAAADVNLQFPA